MKRILLVLSILMILASIISCSAVPFHQREILNKRIMKFDSHSESDNFYSEVFSAREGAAGGYSQGGGGGCGCK